MKEMGYYSTVGKRKYKYIPELILAITKQQEQSSANLKKKTTAPGSHLSRIQKTIAHRPHQLTHVNCLPVSDHILQKYNYLQ